MATRISIPPLTENNLIRNNCFGQGLEFYRYTGNGNAEVIAGPPAFCRFSQGRLSHIFDIDNQVHSAPESVFPFHGKVILKFRARGKGKIHATIRWRLSYGRNDMEFSEILTPEYVLGEDFQDLSFEYTIDDRNCSVNDRLYFETTDIAEITGISLYYPEPLSEVSFDRPHIVALPGEKISFKCSNAQELLCCYGHSENELPPTVIENPENITMTLPATGAEGMRFVGRGSSPNSRNSLFVSFPPPLLAARMRRCRFSAKQKHLLFLGDSLTAYDAGRNYSDIAGAFLPECWSYTNAGIGGDDLPRLVKRLQGKPRTYRLEDFAGIWGKIPDEIFIFYGANDSKAAWHNEYKRPATLPDTLPALWEKLALIFKEKAPQARITLISTPPGSFAYQWEHTRSFREKSIPHYLFCIPEHIKRFNRQAADFARSQNWGYLDFHKICMNHRNRESLFIPGDGVHMTLAGHQLLAAALLEYLQKK